MLGSPRAIAERMAHRTWLAGWSLKDRSAGVARRVSDASVALTFDDGPHPSSTGPVLDVLAQLDVVATFFFVGRNARQHPALVRRALAEGHAVGSHSMNHPHPATTPLRDLAGEYRAGRRAVNDAAGRDVVLFRPPHGHLGFRSAAMVRRLGVSPWLWTVDPEDWRPGRTSRDIVAVAARAQASDVVLLHDWVEQPCAPEARDRSATIEALPAIVRSIRDRGLHLTTLPT